MCCVAECELALLSCVQSVEHDVDTLLSSPPLSINIAVTPSFHRIANQSIAWCRLLGIQLSIDEAKSWRTSTFIRSDTRVGVARLYHRRLNNYHNDAAALTQADACAFTRRPRPVLLRVRGSG